MTSATFVEVLELAARLTPEEQQQLVAALTAHQSITTASTTGAAFVDRVNNLPPIDPTVLDTMERVIEEDCERIARINIWTP